MVATSTEAPVPEPAHLVATVIMRHPRRVFELAGALLGDKAATILLEARPALLALRAGLPASVLDSIADDEPVVGVVLKSDAGLEGAAAFRLVDSTQLLARLSHGNAPPFRAEHDPISGGDVLVAERREGGASLGLFGRHLVVATTREALLAVGPYLDRNLGLRAASLSSVTSEGDADIELEVEASAIRDFLAPRLPASAPALSKTIEPLLRMLEGHERVHVSMRATADLLSAAGSSRLAPGIALPRLSRGKTSSAFDAPRGVHASIAWFEDANARTESAESAIGSLPGLAVGATRLHSALLELAAARGDRSVLAFERGARGPALFGSIELGDGPRAEAALFEATDASNERQTRAALAEVGVSVVGKKTVLERVGDVARFRIGAPVVPHDPASTGPDDASPRVDLYARVERGRLFLGAGPDAIEALDRARDDARLSDEPQVKAFVSRSPGTCSVALFVDIAGLSSPRAARSFLVGSLQLDGEARTISWNVEADGPAIRALVGAASAR